MKAAAFDLVVTRTVKDAIAQLSIDGAKVLAGGQSLGPMLNLRLARPSLLVDVTRIPELRAVDETDGGVAFGSCITHSQIEDGRVPDPTAGAMMRVATGIAYRAVRNRGTIGGSLVHADPAGDWPVALLGLGASVRIAGRAGVREVDLQDFSLGAFASVVEQDEVLVAVFIPRLTRTARWGYWKFCRKVGEYAESMCAVLLDPDRGVHRIAIGATDGKPILLTDRNALRDTASLEEAVRGVSSDVGPVALQQRIAAARRAFSVAERP